MAHPPVYRSEANAIALSRSTRQVIAVGDQAVDLGGAAGVECVRAYDPVGFNPHVTAAFIQYWKWVLYQDVRPTLLQALVLGVFDRFQLELDLPGLDGLGTDARSRLSSALGTAHIRTAITVNSRRLDRPRR